MTAPRCLLTLTVLLGSLAEPLSADIYRWDNGQVIPGTEGIEPGPSVMLDRCELSYAQLGRQELTDFRFESSNLTNAYLSFSTLTQANLSVADLTTRICMARRSFELEQD